MRTLKSILLLLILIFFSNCKSTDLCKINKNCFKKVDKSKPYWVESKYYMFTEKEDVNKTYIKLKVFDRIEGTALDTATVWINNKDKYIYTEENNVIYLDTGVYDINVSTYNNLPLKINDFKLNENQAIEINVYLGNSLQF